MRIATFIPLVCLVAIDLLVHIYQLTPSLPDTSRQARSGYAPLQRSLPSVASGGDDGALTLDAVTAMAKRCASSPAGGGAAIVVLVRWEQADEAANFIGHVRAAGLLGSLLALALDEPSLLLLRKHGVASAARFPLREEADFEASADAVGLPSLLRGAHSPSFAARLRASRWRLAARLLRSGTPIWMSDVRVLWRRAAPPPLGRDRTQYGCDVAFATRSYPPLLTAATRAAVAADAAALATSELSYYMAEERTARWMDELASSIEREAPGADASTAQSLLDGPVLHREMLRCAGAYSGVRRDAAGARRRAADGCPRWCMLESEWYPNGLHALQQPEAAVPSSPPRLPPIAILADSIPSSRFAYRLREARLWHEAVDQQARGGEARGGEVRGGEEAGKGWGAVGHAAAGERFLAYKELLINNGLSNARNALRSALAVARLTNRTLILPPFWSGRLVTRTRTIRMIRTTH